MGLASVELSSTMHMQEIVRLNALASFEMLDTPRERDFDEIAQLASGICETPIAVVNLIGEGRQFFKAEVGLGVRETPIDSSFCAQAILEEDFLIVPDATKDPRFDCNPLVTGDPGLRFYAGALLKTAEGHAIGTVCVLDYRPRDLTEIQQQTLKVLSRQVMRQLELRKAVRERDAALAQQAVLNGELAHRMKNTLAMVQAIAMQTLKGVTERDAVDALGRRIAALGAAHDQLIREDWTAAPIHKIIRLLLDLHGDGGRILTSGPGIELGPKATLSASLLLHEMATNATKHGALSVPEGKVDLSWTVAADGAEPTLRMTWREAGGPPVSEPTRKSFGSRLIQMGLVGKGGVDKRYLPGGLVATFEATMADIHAL